MHDPTLIPFFQIVLVLAQVGLLIGIIHLSTAGGRLVLQRFFNPGCWYTLFYLLWFLIPQIVSITNDNFVLELPGATAKIVLRSQLYLLAFNSAVALGLLLVRLMFDYRAGTLPSKLSFRDLRGREKVLLFTFYMAGCAATAYLGTQLLNSEGMRSELVKTPMGLLATSLAFFGVFAMAVLVGHGLYERKYVMAILSISVLGGAIFFTGARGRLLWPVSLAVAYVLCRSNRIKFGHLIALGTLGFMVLLVFDPVLTAVRGGLRHFDMREVREKVMISNLFMTKRNFDGFANFTLIVTNDSLRPDPRILLHGARTPFMEHYFPGILEGGVGFGTTFPGMLWLSGRFYALLLGGLAYGGMLGLLGFLMRRIRHEPMFWSYMFAMTWLAAVGGNFQESLDKMIAIAMPGFIWLALIPPRKSDWQGTQSGAPPASQHEGHSVSHADDRPIPTGPG